MSEMRTVSVSYHPDIDFLEVQFEKKSGYFDETDDARVMVRYDKEGNVIGFAVHNVKSIGNLLDLELKPKASESAR
ncbi:MAG: DUF2283 domain-containing protein [Chloroflexi bacterium]|nr:DUF2283 domain-containing protein [Chloroflexota bacterium]